jgi:hypothetical protein
MDRNTYTHVHYKVDIKLFPSMNVPWNKITSNNFSYSQKNGWERQLPIEIEIHFK